MKFVSSFLTPDKKRGGIDLNLNAGNTVQKDRNPQREWTEQNAERNFKQLAINIRTDREGTSKKLTATVNDTHRKECGSVL